MVLQVVRGIVIWLWEKAEVLKRRWLDMRCQEPFGRDHEPKPYMAEVSGCLDSYTVVLHGMGRNWGGGVCEDEAEWVRNPCSMQKYIR